MLKASRAPLAPGAMASPHTPLSGLSDSPERVARTPETPLEECSPRARRAASPQLHSALHGPGDAQPESPRRAGTPPHSPRHVGFVPEGEPLIFLKHLQRHVPINHAAAVAPPKPRAGRCELLLPRVDACERWWGGVVARGVAQPLGEDTAPWRIALGETDYNQANPVLLSTCGRYIWADDPSAVVSSCADGRIRVEHAAGADVAVVAEAQPGGLRAAFRAASAAHFPPSGRHPAAALLDSPQYNLWMESNLDRVNEPTQEKVVAYAEAVLQHGMPPGVLMIDTNWAEHYGSFRFHRGRFPDPAAMCAQLGAKGFRVALWVSPFVSPDSETFRFCRNAGLLVRDEHSAGGVALAEWWDGFSALVDFSNPDAAAWFAAGLEGVRALGVAGFKFDGGDPPFYKDDVACPEGCASGGAATWSHPHAQCEAFARFALRYDIAEMRACWKLAGTHLTQRQSDRNHKWDEQGLGALLPCAFTAGLAGYAFVCPDMVGGGQFTDFVNPATLELRPDSAIDGELFVRYAQAAALFPMVQFSLAPWRVLSPRHLAAVVAAARLHARLAPEVMRLAEHAAATGEPLLRHVAYACPDFAAANKIQDQFMLGDDVLVAPVLLKGAATRDVAVPEGAWAPHDGARGWRLLRRGGAEVAAAVAAADKGEAADADVAQGAELAPVEHDTDSEEGLPVMGPALVRVAAMTLEGELRPLPWFSRLGSGHRLGLARTATQGMRLAELGLEVGDEDAPVLEDGGPPYALPPTPPHDAAVPAADDGV